MTHEELRGLMPAYAIDALDPDETRAAEAHLTTCEECRRELAGLREATTLLAAGAPSVAPPRALRGRILAAARASHRPGRWPPPWGLGLAAAAVVVVLLGGLVFSLERRVAVMQRQVARQAQLLSLLASSSAKTVELTGSVPGNVRFVFDPARRQGLLVATGLQNPGPQSVYQVWLISGPRPVSAGVFRPVPGQTTIVAVETSVGRYRTVAISVEPGPSGSPQPTKKPVFVGTLSGTGRRGGPRATAARAQDLRNR